MCAKHMILKNDSSFSILLDLAVSLIPYYHKTSIALYILAWQQDILRKLVKISESVNARMILQVFRSGAMKRSLIAILANRLYMFYNLLTPLVCLYGASNMILCYISIFVDDSSTDNCVRKQEFRANLSTCFAVLLY